MFLYDFHNISTIYLLIDRISGSIGKVWGNENIMLKKTNKEIDLTSTLHNMSGTDLLKITIELGVDTPDFIPSIPTFKNELKSEYRTAYDTFSKAYK